MKRLQFKTIGEATDIGKLITAAAMQLSWFIPFWTTKSIRLFSLPSRYSYPAFVWKKASAVVEAQWQGFVSLDCSLTFDYHISIVRHLAGILCDNCHRCAFSLLRKHDAQRI
jgi:hypothetical protein